jgi:hypothetical protein
MAAFDKLLGFCLPGGEQQARGVRAVRSTQRGQMRSSPDAKWISFTAEERIEVTRSSFRWVARIGGSRFGFVTVTDAYEERHGRLVVKLGGIVPAQKVTGPEADKGELQRYFAAIVSCPAALVNNPRLEWTDVGPAGLRVRDRDDATDATVDFEIGDDGRPLVLRAERPRIAGKQAVLTPWSARALEFREWEGLRVASRIEVDWILGAGPFTYFRAEVESFAIIR